MRLLTSLFLLFIYFKFPPKYWSVGTIKWARPSIRCGQSEETTLVSFDFSLGSWAAYLLRRLLHSECSHWRLSAIPAKKSIKLKEVETFTESMLASLSVCKPVVLSFSKLCTSLCCYIAANSFCICVMPAVNSTALHSIVVKSLAVPIPGTSVISVPLATLQQRTFSFLEGSVVISAVCFYSLIQGLHQWTLLWLTIEC